MTGQRQGAGALLSLGGKQFRCDNGSADPAVAAALEAWSAGRGTERAALTALQASRLLVPVVAVLGELDETGKAEKNSEMALAKLIGNDGRPAIVAFTSTAALGRWRADARPVPAEAYRVWQAAAAESAAVVVDVAGPVPFVVEGARLAALAVGQPPPLPHEDPDIREAVEAVLAGLPAITGAWLGPGTDSLGTDLAVRLTVARGSADANADADLRAAAERISSRLAGRLRAVEVSMG